MVNLAAFLLCASLLSMVSWQLENRRIEAERARALAIASDNAQTAESRLQRLMSATYLLAAYVKANRGQVDEFEALATEILPFYPGVTSLALSPDGVIRYAVPLEPNRGSIGFNQLADPVQSPEAFLARDTGKLTLAGPLELVQGGLGAVGRLPIFLPDANDQTERFWGFANVIIRFPQAFDGTSLEGLSDLGYRYQLTRTHPETGATTVIATSADVTPQTTWLDPVRRPVRVPNAEWVLELEPRSGWWQWSSLLFHAIVIAGFSGLMALLTHLFQNLAAHRRLLETRVAERTREIETARQDLATTLDAVPDLMIEVDANGVIHGLHAPHLPDLLVTPEQAVGHNINELLPPEALAIVNEALQEAARHGRSTGRQYELPIPGGPQWFELSVAAKKPAISDPPGQATRFISLARNITARKQSELQFRLAAEFFNGTSEGFVITDANQRIIQINPAFTTITGYSPQEVIGKKPHVLSAGRHDAAFYQAMWSDIERLGHWEGEVRNRRRNGEEYPEWLSISRIQNDEGHTTHYVAIFSDISRRLEQEARIRNLAYFDPLTGLANRTLLRDRAEHDLSMSRRRKTTLSLLFIDLDHFKHINDSLGHLIGDQLLVEISQRLSSHMREQDTVARLGGDEFMALLPDTHAEGAAHMARQLLDMLSKPFVVGTHELAVTPSIGIAIYPNDGTDFDSLYRCADTAMYRAKQEGRNRFAFFTPEMQALSMRRLQLETALRKAIERGEMSVHYQPQQCLSTQRITGVEALLRWYNPELGAISPAEFIPIAESTGQIVTIGAWVMKEACMQAQRWRETGIGELMMAVNLSAVQFKQPDLTMTVARVLQETGLPARCLELELTESTAMHNPEMAIATVRSLRELGVELSVDDFGTGYSSLNYLKRFQINKLKIDQSFVKGLPDNAEDASIVETIIRMAEGLGLATIAEGVETPAQLSFLRQHGCQQIQGYLLARPLDANGFESWWRGRLSAKD